MKKYKVLIVEDDPTPLKTLLRLLDKWESIDKASMKVATTYAEAQKIIVESDGFDFSIMDVQLDEGQKSFTLVPEHNKEKLGVLVFNTIDSLGQEFLKEISHLIKNYIVLGKPYTTNGISQMMSQIVDMISIKKIKTGSQRFSLNLGFSEKFLEDVNDILFINGAGKYCTYYIEDKGSITEVKNVAGSLESQAELLSNHESFLRVHKSYIVNTSKIKRARKDMRDTGWLSFTDADYHQTKNPMAARYSIESPNYEELKKRIGSSKL